MTLFAVLTKRWIHQYQTGAVFVNSDTWAWSSGMQLSLSLEHVSGNTAVTLYLMRGGIAHYSHASSTILITKRYNDIAINSSVSASWLSKSRTSWTLSSHPTKLTPIPTLFLLLALQDCEYRLVIRYEPDLVDVRRNDQYSRGCVVLKSFQASLHLPSKTLSASTRVPDVSRSLLQDALYPTSMGTTG
ncbi:hypothetical protein ARMGADRAFT_817927 [Armillaria gallica]|uniref:Uncharacterized protein n=1 Tax=Armillaria gallica TaxID=47427 RepID=A0A2H3CY02_ARMGA|nr:hypothetical protein ARMGADRAFT_817927 [Armillaria gallica]